MRARMGTVAEIELILVQSRNDDFAVFAEFEAIDTGGVIGQSSASYRIAVSIEFRQKRAYVGHAKRAECSFESQHVVSPVGEVIAGCFVTQLTCQERLGADSAKIRDSVALGSNAVRDT